MKKLLSTNYSAGAFNVAMLVLRLATGILMMSHGYDKLIHFSQKQHDFINFLGMGSTMSLALVIFAEFFCALFIILGLFTRLASVPLVIAMAVALVKGHKSNIFDGETATLFLAAFLVLLLVGPGRVSVDSMTGK